ncbi:MAG: hypothetical protein R3B13_22615 [Polyangiaceae bacterium]
MRVLPFLLSLVLAACASHEVQPEQPAQSGVWSNSPSVCGVDQVREYHCEELLPRESTLPAPPPFEACPSSIDSHAGVHGPVPPIALFDSDYTAHTRRRMPPGHSCCYSWCAPLTLAAPSQVLPNSGCTADASMRETYCFDVPESGTSQPAPQPFDRCPSVVQPSEATAFAVPKAAPFDATVTTNRRSSGFNECCYSWCSKAPPVSTPKKK